MKQVTLMVQTFANHYFSKLYSINHIGIVNCIVNVDSPPPPSPSSLSLDTFFNNVRELYIGL